MSGLYRLFYSKTPEVRKRRLTKALSSESRALLCDSAWLEDHPSLEELKEQTQRDFDLLIQISHRDFADLNSSTVGFLLSYFRSVVMEFSEDEAFLSGYLDLPKEKRSQIIPVLNFEKKFDVKELLGLFPVWMREQLRFHPCSQNLSAKELFNLGKKIEKAFPEIHFKTLQSLDLYDRRIPEQVELQPLGDRLLHIQTESSAIEVSFIIPTYQNPEFLRNCLRHLINQTLERTRYEIIVVDDGSPEPEAENLKSFLAPEKNNLNLSYFHIPKNDTGGNNLGQFRAGLCRNFGYSQARGNLISFLDSDMIVPPQYAERIRELLLRHDIVQFTRHHINPTHSNEFTVHGQVPEKKLFIEEAHYWKPFFDSPHWMSIPDFWKYTCTYSLSLRKEEFRRLGKFRRTFVSYGFEDTDLGYRAAQKGLRFHLEQMPLLHLTHFTDKARYHHSMYYKHRLLKVTAKTFYFNHLSPEIYEKLKTLLD